jgi:2,4-dienoyl-CoA reductase-like NADH-dependent reductase (Old Yellow Enzyme family)
MLVQFLSPTFNRREDRYGGNVENRARIVNEIIDGIRAECGPDFQIGLRLSAERFGLRLGEVRDVAAEVLRRAQIDYLDMSLWDVTKEPMEDEFRGRSLMSYFTELSRGNVRLGAAGKVATARQAAGVVDAGCDFVLIGRAAILHHDFPERTRRDANYVSPPLPVSVQHLRSEGVADPFIGYLRTSWPGFVVGETAT